MTVSSTERASELDAEMRRLRERLEQYQRIQVGLLEELREARDALADRDRMHDNFIRMISHELKTPISSMQLTLRVMETDPAVDGSERLANALERLASGTSRLHQLVATTTEWGRIRSGRRTSRVSELELGASVERAVEASRRYAERKEVVIDVDVDAPMRPLVSDGDLVDLLLANLVMRAVQLSSRGPVAVRAREEAGRHVVEVEDTARPIRAVAELFDPLRSPSELLRRCGGGSGLALSVLDDLARALGGSLEMRPGERSGNTTVLTLPALAAERVAEAG